VLRFIISSFAGVVFLGWRFVAPILTSAVVEVTVRACIETSSMTVNNDTTRSLATSNGWDGVYKYMLQSTFLQYNLVYQHISTSFASTSRKGHANS